MAAWLFTAAAWTLVIAGVLIAWRFGWRDPGKGTRRCARCWYDMSATVGLKCPECGHQTKSENRLCRRRIRRRWIAVGAMVAFASWFPFKWPEYQRLQANGDAWLAFLPRTAIAMSWPALLRWSIASRSSPSAWWAMPDSRGYLNFSELLETKRLWQWQQWLKLKTCASVVRTSENDQELLIATDLMRFSTLRPRWLADAVMERLVDPIRGRSLRMTDAFIAVEQDLDPKWATPLLHFYANATQLFQTDARPLFWLARTGKSMDSLVPLLEHASLYRERRVELASSLAQASLSQNSRRFVTEFLMRTQLPGGATLLPRHVERIELPNAAMARSLGSIAESDEVYAAILACVTLAQTGITDPDVMHSLNAAAGSSNRAVARASRITTAILLEDEGSMRRELKSIIDFLGREKRRDERMYDVTVMYEFARRGLLPDEIAVEGILAVADAEINDNWFDVGRSAALLVEMEADRAVGVREVLVQQIVRRSSAGYFTIRAYIARGDAPREIIDASRRYFLSMPEPQRSRELPQLDGLRQSD